MDYDVESAGEVTRITIHRAPRLNSLNTALLLQLASHIARADDGHTKAIVITGAGRAFCAGADLSSLVDGETVAAANEVVRTITRVRPVVIAAINGVAAGVGASIALACDLTVAVQSASISVPFLPLGLVPDGGATHTLVARAGAARAARIVFGGERLSAAEASEWGLIGQVVPDDEIERHIAGLVERIVGAPAEAVFGTKVLLRRSDRPGLETAGAEELEIQAKLLRSPEYALARTVFLERRSH